ncbi:nuclear transport factor 2 family protein [Paraburkholderia pallida]|uniref:Nuclear transport factor 2 family protein n=1 Tax=Paraburkholderia pallida TaxID=2547399 RepID=A0A4P7CXJ7_9BURK|nr:nuclear transport factor 2 family protein [Paraburkholderia pallida]QBQ98733.1 nuclear transport factor 2 family protein [Paraburkholderia pallida]
MISNTEDTVRDEVIRLEAERCHALVTADLEALDRLVADDVVHVHANGQADDKAGYLAMVSGAIRFLSAQRERLDVRVYDGLAVATGPLRQSIEMMATGQRVDMHIMTTQVWRLQSGAWRQVSFQATNL